LVNQLGQGCTLTVKTFLRPTGYITSDEFSSSKISNYKSALFGGAVWFALYIYLTIEHRTVVNPLPCKRTDLRRSYINISLNLLYNGLTVVICPYSVYTSGHHVNVDRPSRSGSTPVDNFLTNSVIKRGCSCKLLKNRTQLF
jgi:hypothetical protein